MIRVSEETVEEVARQLDEKNYDLKAIFQKLKKDNPRIGEYIQAQAQKSKVPTEIIGTGIVVYLLIKQELESKEAIDEFLDSLNPEDLLQDL